MVTARFTCVTKPEGQEQRQGAGEGLGQDSGVRGWSLTRCERVVADQDSLTSGAWGRDESAEKCSCSEIFRT